MERRTFVHRAGKSVIRKIAVLSLLIPIAIGCDTATPLSEVKAVAAGAASLAPFFAESSGLGRDADVRSRPAHGGLQQGDTPGLYGGTGEAKACDVERLKRYLTEPRNGRTARAWAAALDLRTDRIPEFLDGLTPVLLRHDTLVRNHDYKKGKAVPFNALLQAGNAILVDEHGLPAVKCSCGNPLRPFEGDEHRISVTFDDANEKWKGYDRDEVVVVLPASRELERIALVDVDRPGRGLERPVGTSGERDSAFDTRKRRTVPSLTGATFGEASRLLTGRGLAVAHDGPEPPPADARVTASDPAAGAALPFGAYVRLSVAEETDAGGDTSRPV
ncbi:PASTA domain-containing protein, partial [Streptomyces sp. SID7804]|uniref:PASTA domain-containing protein n=1 Tax=Streptomyces sp. SID7804 TaxID=2690327 RepID=UPI00136A23AB